MATSGDVSVPTRGAFRFRRTSDPATGRRGPGRAGDPARYRLTLIEAEARPDGDGRAVDGQLAMTRDGQSAGRWRWRLDLRHGFEHDWRIWTITRHQPDQRQESVEIPSSAGDSVTSEPPESHVPSGSEVLSKPELLRRVVDALVLGGLRPAVTADHHPFELDVHLGSERIPVRVYIWNLTHGGGQRSADEQRIQITGVDTIDQPPGGFSLLLGWKEEFRVFTAYDPRLHAEIGRSPSLQVAEAALVAARESGLATHRRGNDELVFCFHQEGLALYLHEQAELHAFAPDAEAANALELAVQGTTEEAGVLPDERRRVVRKVGAYVREWSFRSRVLAAYDYACAVCGVQLRLVEAAHIVPVGVPRSTDETVNGVALCALHHDAYDRGFLGVLPVGRHAY